MPAARHTMHEKIVNKLVIFAIPALESSAAVTKAGVQFIV